jgi:hypothetical protein
MKGLMNKLFLVVALGIFVGMSQGVRADFECYRRVLNDFSVDSRSFQIYSEEVSELFDEQPENAARESIRLLEKQLECNKKALNPVEVSCKDIVPGNIMSRVCYAENRDGYFFISLDLMENVNIVFNRWD